MHLLDFTINGIMWHMHLAVWILSLTVLFLDLSMLSHGSTLHSFLWLRDTLVPLLISSPADGHGGWVLGTLVHVSLNLCLLFPWEQAGQMHGGYVSNVTYG